MPSPVTRRAVFAAPLLAVPALSWAAPPSPAMRLAALDRDSGGRLGVAVLDTGSGKRISHRAEERFPLLSTFKFLAAGLVLARVDAGEEQLDRRIRYTPDDLVEYSPATEKHVADGMTLKEICKAAMTLSDNTAGNLMLASFGGPAALTAYVHKVGASATRLDRTELTLNDVPPGDPRDSTTPADMLVLMQCLLLGDTLAPASRKQLTEWLIANTTGGKRLRAGLPGDWRVGDKTGTAGPNANDIAIVWPPGRAPILIASYLAGAKIPADQRNAMHAEVGRLVATSL